MQSARKFKLIYNPASRAGKSRKELKTIREKLDKRSVDYTIEETEFRMQAVELVKEAKEQGYTHVVALGGDGTVHEVANGAIIYDMPFAAIPLGSGNDFAAGIGLKGLDHAIDTMLNGRLETLPILKAGDRYSINVTDAGFGADVVETSYRRLRWMKGQLKYTLLTFGSLGFHKKYPVTISIDGETEDYDLNILALGFGQTFGSGLIILPGARFGSDEFEVCIVHSASRLAIARLFPKLFSGQHVKITKYVTMKKAKKISVKLRDPDRYMSIEAEGEIFEKVKTEPLEISIVRDKFRVIVPQDWDINGLSLKAV